MELRTLLVIPAALALAACGISKEEHEKLLGQAKAEQKADFDAEMKKMQEACAEDKEEYAGQLAAKNEMIGGLEKKVESLGGNLEKVRNELGERVEKLASTKSELEAQSQALREQSKQLQATKEELAQLKKLREQAEQEAAQFKALANQLKSMVDAGQLSVQMRDGRINLKLPDAVLFPSGSKRLKKEGREALEKVAEVLKGVDREFLIAGHTDDVPVKRGGRFKNNWELSTARAVTVVQLLTKEGVPAERLAAAGFGEFDPLVPNDTKENRAKNRRLEIILLPNIQPLAM